MKTENINKKEKRAAYIRSLLILHGIKATHIAADEGVTRAYVSMVIHGRERSPRVSKAIAQALIDRITANKSEQKTARVRKRIALALGIREEDVPGTRGSGLGTGGCNKNTEEAA